jgi:hypothetical protein
MAAVDKFTSSRTLLDMPPDHAFAITPSDTNDLPYVTRYIYVGASVAGDVALVTMNGEEVTFKNVPPGTQLRIRASRVLATGTGSSMNLVGLY